MFVLGLYRSTSALSAVMVAEYMGEDDTPLLAITGTYSGNASFKKMKAEIEQWTREGGPFYGSDFAKVTNRHNEPRTFEIALPEDMAMDYPKIAPLELLLHDPGKYGTKHPERISSGTSLDDGMVVPRKDLGLAVCRLAQALADDELRGAGIKDLKTRIQAIDLNSEGVLQTKDNLVLATTIAVHAIATYRVTYPAIPDIDYGALGNLFREIANNPTPSP